jgi:acetolactate synthase-1/2/3 large subunit
MGCHGEYVERAADLPAALERATASGKPAVIHAVVDPDANVDPPGMWVWTTARSGELQM